MKTKVIVSVTMTLLVIVAGTWLGEDHAAVAQKDILFRTTQHHGIRNCET